MAARLSAGDVADLIANDNGDEPEDLSDDEETQIKPYESIVIELPNNAHFVI